LNEKAFSPTCNDVKLKEDPLAIIEESKDIFDTVSVETGVIAILVKRNGI